MTSLQKQLATIAANASHELDLKAQKSAYSKSLLFEPLVASNQSLEHLFHICYEGFEELCAIDARFAVYKRSLFNAQSIKEDRERMTSKENENLNNVIVDFLRLAGSKLLLKPAMKAVEWLVRRFRIHEYNTVTTVLAFLPYHLTSIFPTLLSILPKTLDPALKFLHPYINSLSNPPRSTIIYNSIHNQHFFKKFNEFVVSVCKVKASYHTLLSFWASVVTQTIDGILNSSQSGRLNIQRQREEDILSLTLPILEEGLSQKKSHELILGCYMIIVVLCNKATLSESVIDALISAVSQSWTTETCEAGLGCIALLSEQKEHLALPLITLKNLVRVRNLGEKLETLREFQSVQKLSVGAITGLVERAVTTNSSEDLKLVNDFIRRGLVPSNLLDLLRRSIYRKYNATAPHMLEKILDAIGEASLSDHLEDSSCTSMELVARQNAFELPPTTLMELDPKDSIADLNASLANFVAVLGNVQAQSFLADVSRAIVSETDSAFYHCLSSWSSNINGLASELYTHFRLNEFSEIQFLTFLLSYIHTERSVKTICWALKLLIEYLKLTQPEAVNFGDTLLPYALISLSHPFRQIRSLGADLIVVLDNSQKGGSSSPTHPLSSINTFHGHADQFLSVSSDDLQRFVRPHLMPELEECIADRNHINLVIRTSLDDHGRSEKNESGQSAKRLKSSLRKRLFVYLTAFVNYSPLPLVRLRILSILNQLDKVAHEFRSQLLKKTFTLLLTSPLGSPVQWEADTTLRSEAMEQEICNIAHPRDADSVEMLLSIISDEKYSTRPLLQAASLARLAKISEQMKMPMKDHMAQHLLQFSTESRSSPAARYCQDESVQLLRTLHLSPSCLQQLLDSCLKDMKSLKAPSSAVKRRRVSEQAFVESVDGSGETTTVLTKTSLTLELLQTSSSEPTIELLYSGFRLLQAQQDYRSLTSSDLGYLQTLTLSILSSYLGKLLPVKLNSLDHSIVRADLLVDCARDTSNYQNQNSAILLLAQLAKCSPQTVLHSVMPIFTLMSASTAQQGDDCSAHVVDQTIQTVIPLLAKAIREQKKELIPATAEILSSFAAAFDHIPTHRRFRLFSLLASSLGPDESLFAIIATLVDRFPTSKEVEQFSARLVRHFSMIECLKTVSKYLWLGLDYFEKSPQLYNLLIRDDAAPTRRTTSVENILSVLPTILNDPMLQISFTQAYKTSNNDTSLLSELLSQILERILKLSAKDSNTMSFRPLCSQLLESMLRLFPFTQFINSVDILLKDSDEKVCKSLLKTLEVRVASDTLISKAVKHGAMHILPQLLDIVEDSTRTGLKLNAIACVDQICGKFGKLHTSVTLRAAETISSACGIGSPNHIVRTLSLHCLASCVGVLQNEFIPLLQPVWNSACECLRYATLSNETNVRLHNASHALLFALVTELPFLITQDLLTPLLEVSYLASSKPSNYELKEDRRQLYRLVASQLESKVLFSSLSSAWNSVIDNGIQPVREFLSLLKAAIVHHTKTEVNKNSRALFSLFVEIFDFRRRTRVGDVTIPYRADDIDVIEEAIVDTLLAMVLKINDATLRPFFIRLVDWCQNSLPKTDTDGRCSRWITFTKFLISISEKLTSIVTVYFSYPLDQFAEILRARSMGIGDQELLLSSVLEALTSGFKHDQDDFWQNPSHFDAVMLPLVELIEMHNSIQVRANVLSAVTELAATSASPEHHKILNTAVLKLLRSDNPRTRLNAVKCQQFLTGRLGDEWLANLPEMLPIINELQEDDDESVERETHRWIKTIEDTLGESLNAMLQ